MENVSGDTRGDESTVFCQRLNWLFENVHPPQRDPYSNREVAALIAKAGGSLSATYVWQLRAGRRKKPSMEVASLLAKAFGFPVAYFFDDEVAAEASQQFSLLKAMQGTGIESVAHRMIGLSPDSIAAVLKEVDRVRELEGLPPASG